MVVGQETNNGKRSPVNTGLKIFSPYVLVFWGVCPMEMKF
jgi:hypothetical protein